MTSYIKNFFRIFSENLFLIVRVQGGEEGAHPLYPPLDPPLYDKPILIPAIILDGLPGGDIAKQLLEAIKAKKDFDELQTLLNEISSSATGQADDADGKNDTTVLLKSV